MKRSDKESVAELIIREEELYTELQQSLTRARRDRPGSLTSEAVPVREHGVPSMTVGPPSTPSRSPVAGRRTAGHEPTDETAPGMGANPVSASPTNGTLGTPGFFEDEMRGYRLLHACRLSHQERQNVLVQTSISTSSELIRRALRTLFADDGNVPAGSNRHGRIWYASGMMQTMTECIPLMRCTGMNGMNGMNGHPLQVTVLHTGMVQMTGGTNLGRLRKAMLAKVWAPVFDVACMATPISSVLTVSRQKESFSPKVSRAIQG